MVGWSRMTILALFWTSSRAFSTPLRRSTPTFLKSATMEASTTAAPLSAAQKLQQLRVRMKELNLDVYIVPSGDPHLSEYVPAAYARRAYLTGFKGSAGTAVVTQNEAHLWTDSRYWNEAGLQLDQEHWTLQKQGMPTTLTIPQWLAAQGKPKVGIDPFVHPASFQKDVTEASSDITLDTSHTNLIDPIWNDRPDLPTALFRVHPLEYAGQSWQDKVQHVREQLLDKQATLAVFSALDDVAYLFNLRAQGDIETCPVGVAYATVSPTEVTLYCSQAKVANVQDHLQGVTIADYDSLVDDLKDHVAADPSHKVWLDSSRSNLALVSVVPEEQLVDAQNPIVPLKACKNEAELQGMRQAHIVDGAAMAEFMAWLTVQDRPVSEVEIDEVLTGCRAKQPGFIEVSFPTIAGVGANGAIVHYRASNDSPLLKYLDETQPILIDSGGQYEYGTTDVTRTWHLGEATDEFKEYYTRVLKGNIGVDVMIFPESTPGFVLDVYARRWLWDMGKDYGHGTGHGVGAALNVHEGPMSISPRWTNKEVLKEGMVLSNEPGFYEDGSFGIRIENLLEIESVDPSNGTAKPSDKKFLRFKKLTMIPIQKNLIKTELMTKDELDWLDTYHEEVWSKVSPLLEKDSPAYKWLEASCAKIDR